jgi:hypothetical protein
VSAATNPLQFESKVDALDASSWRVEAIDHASDGVVYGTIFTGPNAQRRAEEYAAFKNTAEATLDIVFDGPPGPECGRFVEVETIEGRSVRVGEWIDRGNGLWALRITGSSIAAAIDRAALDGADPALVAMDNAEEVEPQPDEIAASEQSHALDDGSRKTLDEVRTELGIGEDHRR